MGVHDGGGVAMNRPVSNRAMTLGEALALADDLLAGGASEQAERLYRQILSLAPGHLVALNNLAGLLHARGRLFQAATLFERILEIQAGFVPALVNLGMIRHELGHVARAEALFRQALSAQPDHADALSGLGVALQARGAWAEAETVLRRAVAARPDHANAWSNLGVALLRRGRFAEGWPAYAWRWKTQTFAPIRTDHPQPLWDGAPFPGRRLLVHVEQGVGDTLQFARFLPLAAARGGEILLQCEPSNTRLFQGYPGVQRLAVAGAPLPPFDLQTSLLALPGILGCTLETIPPPVPFPALERLERPPWQQRLGASSGLCVGLVWAGDPRHRNDRNRSLPLYAFTPLLALEGIDFFSLQVGAPARQIDSQPGRTPRSLEPFLADFADTALAMRELDLVITVDTAAAHLAGSLGRPVWALIPFAPDWRWLLDRGDSPWYPGMRLFRQEQAGAWDPVLRRITAELRDLRDRSAIPITKQT